MGRGYHDFNEFIRCMRRHGKTIGWFRLSAFGWATMETWEK